MVVKKKNQKRLTRSSKNKMLGGVCSGLADFFEIEATIVRIIFVVITLFGGSGILLYLVLWLVMPNESYEGQINEDSIKEGVVEMKESAKNISEKASDYTSKFGARNIFGLGLLVFGVLLLLDNFNIFRFFNLFKLWPVILIILAIIILTKKDE